MVLPIIIQIPIDISGQLYSNSISTQPLLDYIEVLNHDTQVQQWNIDHIDLLVQVATYKINMDKGIDHLFTQYVTLQKQSILQKVNIHIRNTLSTIFSHFTLPELSKQHKHVSVPFISVQTGGLNHILDNNIMFSLLVSSFLCYIFKENTPLVLSRKVLDRPHIDQSGGDCPLPMGNLVNDPIPRLPSMRMEYHTKYMFRRSNISIDEKDLDRGRDVSRRSVLLITVVSNRFQCYVKVSNNPKFMEDYLFESEIYDYFRSLRYSDSDDLYQIARHVINFHGSNIVKKSIGWLPINIELNNGDDVKCKIDLKNIRYLTSQPSFIYMCTEYDPRFSIFRYVIDSRDTPKIFKGYYTIVEILGKLNYVCTFYHGDLHSSNIMINENCSRCKFFDFDCSGLYGEKDYSNLDVISAFSRDIGTYDRLKTVHEENCEWSRNFYFFFDCYRLLTSILIDLPLDISYIEKHPRRFQKTITNQLISFTPLQIIKELCKEPEWSEFVKSDPRSMSFSHFYTYLYDKQLQTSKDKQEIDIYNHYFNDLKKVSSIFSVLFS